MSNSVRKQPIHVGILEISSQNKAILEYFFSDAGKSYFKEVSLEKASAYIIDYDSLGAKESWSSTFDETKKPGIIISIKEVDLPSTIWLKKPLTVKALKDAGESIREMILNEAEKEVTATVDEVEIKEVAEEAADKEIEIIQETSEEKNQDDKYLLDDLLIDKIVDIPSEPISEILFNEEPLETISTKSQDDSIDAIDIIDISKSSVKEEQIADYIEESVLEETVANTEEAALITRPEETLQLDNLLIDEFLEVPKEDLIDTTDAELTFGVEIDEALSLAEQKEPELALAEIDTSVSVSASSTDYASSDNFVDIDLSLKLNTANKSPTKAHISNEQEFISPKLSTEIPETVATNNDDMDLLLESLISGDSNSAKTDEIITNITENNTESDLLDFDLETIEDNIIDTRAEIITAQVENKESVEVTTIKDIEIEKILLNKNDAEPPEKSAEEELQALLEEIRHEADGSLTTKSTNGSNSTYLPTDAEERWKLLCGTNKDTVDLQKLCSFEPNNHILATVVQNIQIAKQTKEPLRVKFKGVIVVIDPETDNIYCDRSIFTEFYANICYEPIIKDRIKVHNLDISELRLYRKKMQDDSEHTHSIEAFLWTTGLLTSRGRLPKTTNIQSKVGLNSWPNLTRVEKIPNMMQIAALFHKNKWSLLEISSKSGASKKHVVAFYNAALALNMIETNGTSISSASLDLKKSEHKNRNLFSRFLKKITA